MNERILAFGANGLVGSRFTDLYHKDTQFITPEVSEVDITDNSALADFFKINSDKFSTVVNFAAITDVDGAQKEKGDEKGLTWQVNVVGARNIAELCKKYSKYLIQISTDFVFPGTAEDPGPHAEGDSLPTSMDLMGWYAWTKLNAEKEIAKVGGKFAIVRISYPFRANFPGKMDFARNILILHDEGKLYPLFSDQKITPSFIDEIAKVLYLLIEEKKEGIFHPVCSGLTTPYEFASYLLEKARGVKGVVKEGSIVEFLKSGKAPRPVYGGLSNEKTCQDLGITLMTWKEAIDELVKQIKLGLA